MAVYMRGDVLFDEYSLSSVLDTQTRHAKSAVFRIDADELLHRPSDKIILDILEEYRLPKIYLNQNKITALPVEDALVDVRGDFLRFVPNDRSTYVDGVRISLRVPYMGHSKLFRTKPNTYGLKLPRGLVEENSVVVSCQLPNDVLATQREEAIACLRSEIDSIEKWLGWINDDIDKWMTQFGAVLESTVESRKTDILEMRKTEAQLGVPIERDDAVAATYAVPVPKRRQSLQPEARHTYEPFEPEPCISEIDFGNIITDIGKVLAMFERLAVTHAEAREERLRDQIIVQLHSIYGAGSAETFSKRGKTDIYLPRSGHAVFIAECKWWNGPKAFKEKVLPQLLDRYIVWRDTHAAIILFIRNRNVSSVISQAVELIRQHPRFVADALPIGEVKTFMLHKNGDEDRQLRLALLTAPIQVN